MHKQENSMHDQERQYIRSSAAIFPPRRADRKVWLGSASTVMLNTKSYAVPDIRAVTRPHELWVGLWVGNRIADALCQGGTIRLQKRIETPTQNTEAPMRKLKITEHVALDGVIQASGEDDFP
jgi:hypothetical protein